jgi:hypothetical protein
MIFYFLPEARAPEVSRKELFWRKILQVKEEQSAWPFPKQVNSMTE